MAGKFFDFLNSVIGDGGKDLDKTVNISADELKKLNEEFKSFLDVIDENNDALKLANGIVEKLTYELTLMKAQGASADALAKIQKVLREEQLKQIEAQNRLKQVTEEFTDVKEDAAKQLGVEMDVVEGKVRSLSRASGKGKGDYSAYTKALGEGSKALLSHSTNILHFVEVFSEFGIALAFAVEQFIQLNEKLIAFQRANSGALRASTLGFDRYGNNQSSNTGSLESIAGTNNLSVDEVLKTFSAFKEGNVLGLTQNLQGAQEDLQKYGVEIGRITKLYGVSDETLSSLSRNLSQNYGVKIKDLTTLFDNGAQSALSAGVNVGKFFTNMQGLSDEIGKLYIKNGAKGIEETAFALSKLGLSVQSLDKVADSMKSFTDVIQKQNSAAALGLTNYANNVASIFAKVQTGDQKGALLLQQTSLATDVRNRYGTDREGNINNQGIQALSAAGLGKDEIASIQRLIRGAEYAGVSIEKYTDETKLSTVQLQKKRKFDQESLTLGERLQGVYAQLKQVVIDPLAAVFAPLADLIINTLSVTFKILGFVLSPVVGAFQILGKAISKITDAISYGEIVIGDFLRKLGFNGQGQSKVFEGIKKGIEYVLAALIAIKAIEIARFAWDKGQAAVNFVGGLLGKAGGKVATGWLGKAAEGAGLGKIAKFFGKGAGEAGELAEAGGGFLKTGGLLAKAGGLGKNLLKGAGPAAILGIGGGLLGDAVGSHKGWEHAGDTISSVSTGASAGALIGSIVPVIGTAAGAIIGGVGGLITSNWDKISGIFESVDGWLSKTFGALWNIGKWLVPMFWIPKLVNAIKDWWNGKTDDKDDKDKAELAIQEFKPAALPDVERINAIMRTREITHKNIVAEQEKDLNRVMAHDGIKPQVHVKVVSDLMGGYKVKAGGY